MTPLVREALKVRRFRRDMLRDGWEEVGEGGGKLWELYRGCRQDHIIVATRIDASGKSIWIKTHKLQ
jgi:hypothetical protein